MNAPLELHMERVEADLKGEDGMIRLPGRVQFWRTFTPRVNMPAGPFRPGCRSYIRHRFQVPRLFIVQRRPQKIEVVAIEQNRQIAEAAAEDIKRMRIDLELEVRGELRSP